MSIVLDSLSLQTAAVLLFACYLYILWQREMSTSNATARAVYSATLYETMTIKTQKKIAKREKNKLKIMRTFE
jgi:hypothetical protein